MTTRSRWVLFAVALFAVLAVPAFADHHEGMMKEGGGNPMGDAVLADFDRTTGHLLELADAFPADKFGWRPAEGVRSVSEVFMHVAAANFHLSRALGAEMPAGVPEDPETVTDKGEAIALLKRSIEHARHAIENALGGDLSAMHEMFGQKMSTATVIVILETHAHEHLGQAIAYARSNGVVPPWSRQEG